MGIFNFFGEGEHRVFDYKPIYYDKDEEERKRRFGAVDGSMNRSEEGSEEKGYERGSLIRGALRDGNFRHSRTHLSKIQTIIGIVSLILVFAMLILIAKFYSLL